MSHSATKLFARTLALALGATAAGGAAVLALALPAPTQPATTALTADLPPATIHTMCGVPFEAFPEHGMNVPGKELTTSSRARLEVLPGVTGRVGSEEAKDAQPEALSSQNLRSPNLLSFVTEAGRPLSAAPWSEASVTQSGARAEALAPCTWPRTDQWIVAGSTTIGRAATLVLGNTGPSTVQVKLRVFTSTGEATVTTGSIVAVPAHSHKVVSLEGIIPDDPRLALHLTSSDGVFTARLDTSELTGITLRGIDSATASDYGTDLMVALPYPAPASAQPGSQPDAQPGTQPGAQPGTQPGGPAEAPTEAPTNIPPDQAGALPPGAAAPTLPAAPVATTAPDGTLRLVNPHAETLTVAVRQGQKDIDSVKVPGHTVIDLTLGPSVWESPILSLHADQSFAASVKVASEHDYVWLPAEIPVIESAMAVRKDASLVVAPSSTNPVHVEFYDVDGATLASHDVTAATVMSVPAKAVMVRASGQEPFVAAVGDVKGPAQWVMPATHPESSYTTLTYRATP